MRGVSAAEGKQGGKTQVDFLLLTCWNCGELRVFWISWPLCGRLSPLGKKGSSLCCTSALLRMGAIISGVHTLARSTAGWREGGVSDIITDSNKIRLMVLIPDQMGPTGLISWLFT